MSDKQTLSITCNLATKGATLSGQIAIRETISLSVTSFGGTVASSLRLGICKKGELFASCNEFTTGETIFTGELDMNTEELVDVFGNKAGNGTMDFELALWDILNDRLLVNTTISVMNNPYSEGMADPTTVDPIAYPGEAEFTDAKDEKLDGIETLADVTDATNVNAAGAVMESDYTANTILRATANATPLPITIAEETLVGRITSGAIVGLTGSQTNTILGTSNALQDTDFSSNGIMKRTASGTYGIVTDNSTAWDAGVTKLAGIETGADVTTEARIVAAGALIHTSFTSNGFMVRTALGSYSVLAIPLPVASGGTNSTSALNNGRIMKTLAGAIVEADAITASRLLVSDATGIPVHTSVTTTEAGYLSGVTSAIQTQFTAKLNKVSAEDLEFTDATKGPIIVDRTTGTKYRHFIDAGIPQFEVVP